MNKQVYIHIKKQFLTTIENLYKKERLNIYDLYLTGFQTGVNFERKRQFSPDKKYIINQDPLDIKKFETILSKYVIFEANLVEVEDPAKKYSLIKRFRSFYYAYKQCRDIIQAWQKTNPKTSCLKKQKHNKKLSAKVAAKIMNEKYPKVTFSYYKCYYCDSYHVGSDKNLKLKSLQKI